MRAEHRGVSRGNTAPPMSGYRSGATAPSPPGRVGKTLSGGWQSRPEIAISACGSLHGVRNGPMRARGCRSGTA